MSTTAAQNELVLVQSKRCGSRSRALLIRFVLAAVAVAVSYCFRWDFLRFLTSEANLRVDLLAGIHLQRISFDTVMWRGVLYHYENACTFIDVWFGSIPLLWSLRSGALARVTDLPPSAESRLSRVLWSIDIEHNLFLLAVVAAGMFCFNISRLSVSDVLFAAGLPWNIAHNVISGISYFLVWIWIWGRLRRESFEQ